MLDVGSLGGLRAESWPGRLVLQPLLVVQHRADPISSPVEDGPHGAHAVCARDGRVGPDSPELLGLIPEDVPQLVLLPSIKVEPLREHPDTALKAGARDAGPRVTPGRLSFGRSGCRCHVGVSRHADEAGDHAQQSWRAAPRACRARRGCRSGHLVRGQCRAGHRESGCPARAALPSCPCSRASGSAARLRCRSQSGSLRSC